MNRQILSNQAEPPLMVRWRAKDVPVTELNAVWHGPIPTSFGPE
jgi:hypothetical protein